MRLTPTAGYAAYTTVKDGDSDQLRAIPNPGLGAIGGLIGYIDTDCSDDWTCVDKLYLKQAFQVINDNTGAAIGNLVGAVTIGDMRLYIPPEEIADNGDVEYNQYDANEDCEIDIDELSAAIDDFYAGTLDIEDLSEVIDYFYLGGEGYC